MQEDVSFADKSEYNSSDEAAFLKIGMVQIVACAGTSGLAAMMGSPLKYNDLPSFSVSFEKGSITEGCEILHIKASRPS